MILAIASIKLVWFSYGCLFGIRTAKYINTS
jgi:hypothetical protein